jgi:hypothetical protein
MWSLEQRLKAKQELYRALAMVRSPSSIHPQLSQDVRRLQMLDMHQQGHATAPAVSFQPASTSSRNSSDEVEFLGRRSPPPGVHDQFDNQRRAPA